MNKKNIKIIVIALILMAGWVGLMLALNHYIFTGRKLIMHSKMGQIIVGRNATELENYAARELQIYIYQLTGENMKILNDDAAIDKSTFLVGQVSTNKLIKDLCDGGNISISAEDPGEQGYLLKKTSFNGHDVLTIAGSDKEGVLYGVYGLLEDHYGMGFYFSGDVYPEEKLEFALADVDEKKAPKQYIRGVLPWTNFPQSATSYSMDDWKYIIDTVAKMRMNLINLHNYNGFLGHNEMFHNFTYNGITSRSWNATAKSGHSWGGPGWDVNKYLFGATDLFSDYDFGADCAIYNENLENNDIFQKGVSEFQQVIEYAHSRGVKIALGIEPDLIPAEYKADASDPGVIDARTKQIAEDYPNLDYLIMYRAEADYSKPENQKKWQDIFDRMYANLKKDAPGIRIGVSGWGLDGNVTRNWPDDVFCAPIAAYSATFDSGISYGNREYWGCPWMERDFDSSVWFYPYKIHLSDTMKSYQEAKPNMKGLMTLTWRLTDAVDPKISYIAKAPWDYENKYTTSESIYKEYAIKNYGENVSDDITAIINENEAFASLWSECMATLEFENKDRSKDIEKCDEQLAVIDSCLSRVSTEAQRLRLMMLRARISAARAFCELDENFEKYSPEELSREFRKFSESFIRRTVDISSLGNVVSSQNRLVQLRFVDKMNKLNKSSDLSDLTGFKAVDGYDKPQVIVISPQLSVKKNHNFEIEARIITPKGHEKLSAKLYYRAVGEDSFSSVDMTNKVKASFIGIIPAKEISDGGMEYYIEVSDGSNTGRYPATAPLYTASFIVEDLADNQAPETPLNVKAKGPGLVWDAPEGDVFQYRIYRSTSQNFDADKVHYLTYVSKSTQYFVDTDTDFMGKKLNGDYYYRITAVDKYGNESKPSKAVKISYDMTNMSPFRNIMAVNYTDNFGTQKDSGGGTQLVGWIRNGHWLKYEGLDFGNETATKFIARIATSNPINSNIEIWVDAVSESEEGKMLGKVNAPETGGWFNFVNISCEISELSGKHDVYLKFTCDDGFVLNLVSFRFE